MQWNVFLIKTDKNHTFHFSSVSENERMSVRFFRLGQAPHDNSASNHPMSQNITRLHPVKFFLHLIFCIFLFTFHFSICSTFVFRHKWYKNNNNNKKTLSNHKFIWWYKENMGFWVFFKIILAVLTILAFSFLNYNCITLAISMIWYRA